MDLITTAVSALAGFGIGYGTHSLIVGNARTKYREIIAAKNRMIAEADERVSDLVAELSQTSDRNGALRLENGDLRSTLTDTERKLGRAQAEAMALKDDAELGKRVKAQRAMALAKAQAANRARFKSNGSGAGAAATARG